MTAIKYRESVTGVVLMDGAVEKIGRQEMAAMEHLVDNLIIYVFSNQRKNVMPAKMTGVAAPPHHLVA